MLLALQRTKEKAKLERDNKKNELKMKHQMEQDFQDQ